MVKFLINRPIAVTMSFIALIVVGLVSMQLVPISILPDVDIPEITIQLSIPEASADEVEERFIGNLRRQLLQVSHIRDIRSISYAGYGSIRLLFNYGTNLNYAYINVNEKIDALMSSTLKDVERPKVIKASATDIPVFYLSVSSDNNSLKGEERFSELSEFTEMVIKKRLEQLPEVAMVDITGMEYPEIAIMLDEEKATALGIGQNAIKEALKQNNIQLGNIVVREGEYRYNVKFSSSLINSSDIENLQIKAGDRLFRLRDLATVTSRPVRTKGVYIDNSSRALSLAVIKSSDVRMEDLKASANNLIKHLKKDYPHIIFKESRNQSHLLDYTIANLKQTLLIGALLAFVVMFIFLSDLKSPLLIGIVIPVSLIISLLFFYLLNVSVNIVSLSGLILGIGLMIDNSIIVIDNITQYRDKNYSVEMACISGTNEVIRPLISSTLTTCAVFVPLVFLSGIAGQLFGYQAIAVVIGLFSSLLVSITLLPVYFRLFYKKKKTNENEPNSFWYKLGVFDKIENTYDKGFSFVQRNKVLFLTIILVFTFLGGVVFVFIQKERLPSFDETELTVRIDWNENINIDESRRRILDLKSNIKDSLLTFSAYIGEQHFLLNREYDLNSSEVSAYIKTETKKELYNCKAKIMKVLTEKYPEAVINIKPPASVFSQIFSSKNPPLIVMLWSDRSDELPSPATISDISNKIDNKLKIQSINNVPIQEYIQIQPNLSKLLLYNINPNTVFDRLKKAIHRLEIGKLKTGQFLVPIVLADSVQTLSNVIKSVKVKNKDGDLFPIASFLDMTKTAGYKEIRGGKEGKYAPLNYEITSDELEEYLTNINFVLDKQNDVKGRFAGNLFENNIILKELGFVLLISLLLLYFILAAQFESILQPLIVLIEIPIDIAGALLLLYVTGSSLNIMAMIGIIVATGIVINDSILKIDTINNLRRSGIPLMEAIKTGGTRRLKSIVMTSLTTILALLPFLGGDDMGTRLQQPLAIAVIGGLSIGTIVSLYFIPLLYYYMYKKSDTNREHR